MRNPPRLLLLTVGFMVAAAVAALGMEPGTVPQPGALRAVPGDDLFAQGRFSDAAQLYAKAVGETPDSGPALARAARVRLYEGRESEAIELSRKALTLSPGDPVATTTLGVATARQRNFGSDLYQIVAPVTTASIPFVITDPLPVVRITVGGHKADFLVDTGGPDITLKRSFADALGLSLTDAGMGTFAGGRQANVQRTVVPELEIGGLQIRNVPAGVIGAGIQLPGVDIQGVVGTGLLMHFLSTIDYCKGELVLAPRSSTADFQKSVSAAQANVVPFWLVADHFIFARGQLNQAEGLFLIDTGLAGGGLTATKDTLDAAGINLDETKTMMGQGGGGAVQFVPFRASATLGKLTRTDLPGVYMPGANPTGQFPFKSSGIISHSFFRQSRLTFDFDAMTLVTESCR